MNLKFNIKFSSKAWAHYELLTFVTSHVFYTTTKVRTLFRPVMKHIQQSFFSECIFRLSLSIASTELIKYEPQLALQAIMRSNINNCSVAGMVK